MKAWWGLGDLLERCLIDMIGKLLLAVARRHQCFSVEKHFRRLLAIGDNMAVDFLRASKQSERLGNCNIFDSLALKFLHYHFYGIPLVTQVSPLHCG